MPANNEDLHGNAPATSAAALLLVDVVNDLEFEGGEELLRHFRPAAERIAALKARARAAGVPVIYANDNFGRWRSDFREVVEHCLNDGVRGEETVRMLRPDDRDYFVLKPKHSAFFATTLDTLLQYLGTRHLVLAGVAGDVCVLFTANDAYMRDLHLHVPSDCLASESSEENRRALAYMERVLGADVSPSAELELEALAGAEGGPG